MAKFTLTIELGNDAMRTYADVALALKELALSMRVSGVLAPKMNGTVRDTNGNTVGMWKVTR